MAHQKLSSVLAQHGELTSALRRLLTEGLNLLANLLIIQRHTSSLNFRTSVLAILKPERITGKRIGEFG
jgi:hypothetical protein